MPGENTSPDSSLGLSDEEFLKQGTALLDTANAPTSTGSGSVEETSTTDTNATQDSAEQGGESGAAGSAAATAEADDATGEQAKQVSTEETPGETQEVPDDAAANKKRGADGKFIKDETGAEVKTDQAKNKEDKAVEEQAQTTVLDPKAELERLFTPFKANGRDLKVESVDEAIRLMQMGANYNRKMAALKPNLAFMKTLENNGLLNAEKINFLIDLDKKNPEAIGKLIKESGIDPLDISADKAGEYKPGNHGANELEVDLDNVLDDIKDSPKFNETLDLVGKHWDAKSRQVIAGQPQLMKVINGHMESGMFDLVASELERKRLFGGLQGLSDLEAYRQVGDEMAASGKFDHLTKGTGQSPTPGQQTTAAKTVVTPAPKKADDSKREEQRRAAAPVKGAAPAGKLPADFSPLSLPDEDFAKFKPNF